MLKSVFNRQKQHSQSPSPSSSSSSSSSSSRPFRDYYTEWFTNLKTNLLPLLRRSISGDSLTLLSTHVELLHQHFQSYYHTLDTAATTDPSQILHQSWHSSSLIPLLWISDLHPFLFTNLARSFLQETDDEFEENSENEQSSGDLHRQWQIAMAWRNPSETLITRMEEIECGLKSIVPTLSERLARAENGLVARVVGDWFACKDRVDEKGKGILGNDVKVYMEEFVSVFLYANRLRRSVLVDIISSASVYQAALFLEGLAVFVVEFKELDFVNHGKDHREFSCSRCH